MNFNTLLAMGIGIPMLVSLLISFFCRRPNNLNEYFYANNDLGGNLVTNLLVSTSLTVGSGFIYFAWLGYKVGWSSLLIQGVWCIGYIAYTSGSHKIRTRFPNDTLHAALKQFGKPLFLCACCVSVIGLCINVGWEVFALLSVFGDFEENPNVQLFIASMLAFIVGTYTAMGGIRGNAYANIIQNATSLAAFVGLPFILFWSPRINISLQANTASCGSLTDLMGWIGLAGTLLNSMVWQFVDTSAWQTVQSSKPSQQRVNWALLSTASVIFLVPGLFGVAAGVQLRDISIDSPQELLKTIAQTLKSNPLALVLFVSGLVCAVLSTIDGLILSVTQIVFWDVFSVEKVADLKAFDVNEREVRFARVFSAATPMVSVLAYSIAKYQLDIFSISFVAFSVQNSLFFPVLTALYHPRSKHNAFAISSFFAAVSIQASLFAIWLVKGETGYIYSIPLAGFVGGILPYLAGLNRTRKKGSTA